MSTEHTHTETPWKPFVMEVMGRKVAVLCPATTSDYEKHRGANAALEGALKIEQYHNWGPAFREAFGTELEKRMGEKHPHDAKAKRQQAIGRDGQPVTKLVGRGDAKTEEPVLESDEVYKNRMFGEGLADDTIFNEIEKVLLEERGFDRLDLTPADGRSGKPNKACYDIAERVIAKYKSSEEQSEWIARHEAKGNGKFIWAFDLDGVASAIKSDQARQKRVLEQSYE